MNYYNIFLAPLISVWETFGLGFLSFVFALILFAVGIMLAKFFANIAKKISLKMELDSFVSDIKIFQKAKKSGVDVHPSAVIEFTVKWFIIISALLIISEYLNLSTVSEFFYDIIRFVPVVIVAIILLVTGFVVGQFVGSITQKSVQDLDISAGAKKFLPAIAEWSIVVFSIFAAMIHLGIGSELIEIFFSGLIYAVAFAFALAFGLGGKQHASKLLDSFFNNKEK